ncbi:MAG: hypothetical protein A3G75_08560 [Verrucomicrobia bacterium RIFCSPLOWO2_12_FULL_64_8]|nr:MAG: hypothetical protein A3G75_08560 [Verrucomicrobia bacterium RIFCSPLOWO2_12_FULL_64_8]
MFVGKRTDGLKFHDELLVDEYISKELTQERSVLVEHVQRMLLNGRHALFSETICKPVLIDFFDVAVAEVTMQREAGLADLITELEDRVFHGVTLLAPSAPFCGKKQETDNITPKKS